MTVATVKSAGCMNRLVCLDKGNVLVSQGSNGAVDKTSKTSKSTDHLPKPSDEQRSIIDLFLRERSLSIQAVFGSGKTTLLLMLARRTVRTRSILWLTYNASLKDEARKKTTDLGLSHVTVHTFNSLAKRYWDDDCWNDFQLHDLVANDSDPCVEARFDVMFVDEDQDTTPAYYWLQRKAVTCFGVAKIVKVGDAEHQAIYKYKGASTDYLRNPDTHFHKFRFQACTLSTSFRLTPWLATFVNTHLIERRQKRVIAGNFSTPNRKVRYIECDIYRDLWGVVEGILRSIDDYRDVLILFPSVRTRSATGRLTPCGMLRQKISTSNLNIAIQADENNLSSDDRIRLNKLWITTYHRSKGCERRVVVVVNFDRHGERNLDALKVACTRSKEMLILVRHIQNASVSCINAEMLHATSIVVRNRCVKIAPRHSCTTKVNVTELVRQMSVTVQWKLFRDHIRVDRNTMPRLMVGSVPTMVCVRWHGGRTIWEDVSDFYGTLIHHMFANPGDTDDATIQKNMLRVITVAAEKECAYHRLRQLGVTNRQHSWVDCNHVRKMLAAMEIIYSDLGLVDRHDAVLRDHEDGVGLTGVPDVLCQQTKSVLEWKTGKSLDEGHILQTSIYLALAQKTMHRDYRGYLSNASVGVVLTITLEDHALFLRTVVEDWLQRTDSRCG